MTALGVVCGIGAWKYVALAAVATQVVLVVGLPIDRALYGKIGDKGNIEKFPGQATLVPRASPPCTGASTPRVACSCRSRSRRQKEEGDIGRSSSQVECSRQFRVKMCPVADEDLKAAMDGVAQHTTRPLSAKPQADMASDRPRSLPGASTSCAARRSLMLAGARLRLALASQPERMTLTLLLATVRVFGR